MNSTSNNTQKPERRSSSNMTPSFNNNQKPERRFLGGLSGRLVIAVACVLIVAGYFLMSGTGSAGHSFSSDLFSPRRIVYAPMLCLAGYLLIIVGILRMGK